MSKKQELARRRNFDKGSIESMKSNIQRIMKHWSLPSRDVGERAIAALDLLWRQVDREWERRRGK